MHNPDFKAISEIFLMWQSPVFGTLLQLVNNAARAIVDRFDLLPPAMVANIAFDCFGSEVNGLEVEPHTRLPDTHPAPEQFAFADYFVIIQNPGLVSPKNRKRIRSKAIRFLLKTL